MNKLNFSCTKVQIKSAQRPERKATKRMNNVYKSKTMRLYDQPRGINHQFLHKERHLSHSFLPFSFHTHYRAQRGQRTK